MMRVKRKSVVYVALAIILCAAGTYFYLNRSGTKAKSGQTAQAQTVTVKKGNLRTTISGTGQLEAEDLQMIVPPKEGMIKQINLTRNQTVKKGDLLLEISDPDTESKMDSAKLTLSQYQKDLNDLLTQQAALRTIAPVSGMLTLSSNISEGASVSASTKIASIADTSELTVTLPFLQDDASQMQVGDSVQLTVGGLMLSKTGTVASVAKATHADAKGNRLTDVEIHVKNDGTLAADQTARATASLSGLQVDSKGEGTLQYKTVTPVQADVSGTIEQLAIKADKMVKAGERIATIKNDNLADDIEQKQHQIQTQQKTVQDLQDQLDKLKVYAPIDGVFSADFADQKKNVLSSYPAGSTIKAGVELGGVASTDSLSLPIQVDELDISKVKAGMKAELTIDAVPGKVFPAEVSQVSSVGTTTNGVTSYDVALKVDNASELKYGMTAKADLIVEDKKDVLLLPIEAVRNMGGKHFVALENADGTVDARHAVEVGSNNDQYVEITSGLKDGDKVSVQRSTSTQKLTQEQIQQMRQQFQGGPGGYPGGGNFGGASRTRGN